MVVGRIRIALVAERALDSSMQKWGCSLRNWAKIALRGNHHFSSTLPANWLWLIFARITKQFSLYLLLGRILTRYRFLGRVTASVGRGFARGAIRKSCARTMHCSNGPKRLDMAIKYASKMEASDILLQQSLRRLKSNILTKNWDFFSHPLDYSYRKTLSFTAPLKIWPYLFSSRLLRVKYLHCCIHPC